MHPDENEEMNAILRHLDDEAHKLGQPIPSVMVAHKAGTGIEPCSITRDSIDQFKLARPGESFLETWNRLIDEYQAFVKANDLLGMTDSKH